MREVSDKKLEKRKPMLLCPECKREVPVPAVREERYVCQRCGCVYCVEWEERENGEIGREYRVEKEG